MNGRPRPVGSAPIPPRPPWGAIDPRTAAPAAPPTPDAPRRRRSWPAGVLVLVLLAWIVGAATFDLVRSDLPATAASRFVPQDGYRSAARFGQGGEQADATVENARIRGKFLHGTISPFLFTYMARPPGVDARHVAGVTWWREAVVPDLHHEPRYRVYSVTDDGVRLHGQDWGRLGLTLEPAPIWLPADVHAGQTWTSHGIAAGAGFTTVPVVDYRMTAVADDAGGDCVRVSVTMDFTPRKQDATEPGKRWIEHSKWCQGRGVVDSTGTLGDHAYSVARSGPGAPGALPDDVREQVPDPAGLARWRHGTLAGLAGDDTFGTKRAEPDPQDAPIVTASGAIVYRSAATFDLVGLLPLDTGRYWQHWWARPGGQIQSLVAFGRLAVVTTSERRMLAYAPGGRLLWSVTLDDVALQPPIRVSGDRLVVASARGLVSMRSALDGHVVWSHRITHGVARPLATDGSVVAALDTKRRVHLLDARTGAERWSVDAEISAHLLAVSGGRTLVAGAEVMAYDNRTGKLRWHRATGYQYALRVNDSEVAVDTDAGVVLFDLDDGTTRGSIAGADDPHPVGNTWFVLTAGSLMAVDGSGTTVRSWRLSGTANDRRIVVGPSRVWVFGRTDALVLTGERVGPRG